MENINELLLLSKNDIPFREAKVNIHQPILKEIAYIGEESFYLGCQLLNFSKSVLSEEDKVNLANKTNFDVFMSVMTDKSPNSLRSSITARMVLSLMFPDYIINFTKESIILSSEKYKGKIDNSNFEQFKDILVQMFCLERQKESEFNPADAVAAKIAAKLEKGRKKRAELNGQAANEKIAILSKYVSILSVGNKKSINDYMDYTVYQINDEFKRFNLKQDFDLYIRAKIAGAKDLEDVDNWMGDIHAQP